MAYRGKRDSADGITRAKLQGTASRHAAKGPVDVDAAVAELQGIADGRTDLLADVACNVLSHAAEHLRNGRHVWARWPQAVTVAALLIQAGADVGRLAERITDPGGGFGSV